MHATASSFTTERRVRKLHLRADSHTTARRTAILLEDALHTASLPDGDDGRVLAIRRLSLGRISSTGSAGAIALSLERAVRDLAAVAVRFDEPGAAKEDSVWLPLRAVAWVELARRFARREETSAWFWDQVVPGWSSTTERAVRWRTLLEVAQRGDDSPLAIAAVVAAAVHAEPGAVREILSSVAPGDAAYWLARQGFDSSSNAPTARSEVTSRPPELGAALRAATRVLFPEPGAGGRRTPDAENVPEVRLVWLGVLLSVDACPTLAARRDLPTVVAATLAAARTANRAVRETDGSDADNRGLSRPEPASPHRLHRAGTPSTTTTATPERPGAVHARPDFTGLEPSDHAGLLFLLPILQRLGLPERLRWDERALVSGFAARLLVSIGRRAGMREEDPLAVALLAGLAPDDPTPASHYLAWYAAVRGWCHRRGIPAWRTLVARRGRVRATRSHLDIHFEPAQAGLALRRLALDCDPGWVPWLGRVVHFHYGHSHD